MVFLLDAIKVNPGPLAEVEVMPPQISLQILDTARLGARALDRFGNEISDVLFTWSVLEPVGNIDETGLFTAATGAGAYEALVKVTATQEAQSREALIDVTIEPGPLSRLVLEPFETTLDIGATQSYTLRASDDYGNKISDALTSWSITADVGTIDASGVLTAGTKAGSFPGAIRVEVVKGIRRASATADVTIRPDPLATIELQPSSVGDLKRGATAQFTAAGFDEYGNEIPGLAFLWEATGGEVDQAGLFTAIGRSGRYEVTATATFKGSSGIGSAMVTIPPQWIATGSMAVSREEHTATLLADGKVLIVGGAPTKLAELYDPATGTFSATGNALCEHGPGATATRLLDGRVLVAGGGDDLQCAEIYDPATRLFSRLGDLKAGHSWHTATLLSDGKVLIAGGEFGGFSKAEAELYDPAAGSSSLSGSLKTDRSRHTATLLPNGQVLVTGGHNIDSGSRKCLDLVEIYAATTGTFSQAGKTFFGGWEVKATLLNNGKVLITEGTAGLAEIFDSSTGTFSATGEMAVLRAEYTATLLPDGRVVIVGGFGPRGPGEVGMNSAEVYDPEANRFTAIADMNEARFSHTATLLPNGQVLVVGGFAAGGVFLSSAELLD